MQLSRVLISPVIPASSNTVAKNFFENKILELIA